MPSIPQVCPCCGGETKTCPICGKLFALGNTSHYQRFCSRECWHTFTRARRPERFWAQVPDRPDEGCWEWTGAISDSGYGVFSQGHKNPKAAHRISYELSIGPIPDGLLVRHMCHNRRCVRPDHLRVGTTQDNMRDRSEAGRTSRHGAPKKLTVQDRETVLSMLAEGIQATVIARHFHVSDSLISLIKKGKHSRPR